MKRYVEMYDVEQNIFYWDRQNLSSELIVRDNGKDHSFHSRQWRTIFERLIITVPDKTTVFS